MAGRDATRGDYRCKDAWLSDRARPTDARERRDFLIIFFAGSDSSACGDGNLVARARSTAPGATVNDAVVKWVAARARASLIIARRRCGFGVAFAAFHHACCSRACDVHCRCVEVGG
jgi:hypothetical protein